MTHLQQKLMMKAAQRAINISGKEPLIAIEGVELHIVYGLDQIEHGNVVDGDSLVALKAEASRILGTRNILDRHLSRPVPCVVEDRLVVILIRQAPIAALMFTKALLSLHDLQYPGG